MPLASSLKAMTAAVYALAPDSFVRHITADSLEVFAQTNPLQPKVFLFTNKRDTPGMYKVLSTTFRKDASFALVHESEKKVVARFKVAKFPHMSIMFPAPSPGREGEVQLTVRDFPGPLKYHTVAPQLMQVRGGGLHVMQLMQLLPCHMPSTMQVGWGDVGCRWGGGIWSAGGAPHCSAAAHTGGGGVWQVAAHVTCHQMIRGCAGTT
ncbi:unnamed protein product [Closterium sp. NIES-54]